MIPHTYSAITPEVYGERASIRAVIIQLQASLLNQIFHLGYTRREIYIVGYRQNSPAYPRML
jgi:hypothetical protein